MSSDDHSGNDQRQDRGDSDKPTRDARGRWLPGNCPNPKGRPKKKPTVLPDQSDSIPTAPETEAEELRRSTSARQRHQSLFRTHVALVTPDLDPLAHTRIVARDLVQDTAEALPHVKPSGAKVGG